MGKMRHNGDHVVLEIDANQDVQRGSVTDTLIDIEIFEAIISNHKDNSDPANCVTDTSRTPTDNI